MVLKALSFIQVLREVLENKRLYWAPILSALIRIQLRPQLRMQSSSWH